MRNNLKIFLLLCFSLIFTNCVYFNTFYNAKLYFDEAEQLRIKEEKSILSNSVAGKYKKVIEKSDIVINNHPDSRYFDNALFFKGRSHYYRREYDLAESAFKSLLFNNPKDYQILSEFWLAQIKWKSGKPQPALNDLNKIISKTESKELLAQIYQSQAKIFLELKQNSQAVSSLEKAAELTKNRQDKGQIYYQLAELSYNIQNYKRAIEYYNNVIKYSFSSERIMDANLKIVQRYRDLKDLDRASKEIQLMLIDPEFSKIHGNLTMELAKLKFTQNDNEGAIQILEDIVVKYPKTEIAAEAFYLLGEQSLLNKRDFVKADYFYKQIQRESPKSTYVNQGDQRISKIAKYQQSKKFLGEIDNKIPQADSLASVDKSIDTSKVVLELYNLGELEAFHLEQIDTSMIYFNRIIEEFSQSDLYVKTIYTLSHLFEQLGDNSNSLKYQELIIDKYPDSDYAENIRLNNIDIDYGISGFTLLSNAEDLYSTNSDSAMYEYKKIANSSNSETAKRAILFIANEYDNILFNADSAKKYYNQIIERFPDSEQATIAKNRSKYLKK